MPVETSETQHLPVLVQEVVDFVKMANPTVVVDATLGFGGHTMAILEALPNTRVVAFDQDPIALALASDRLSDHRDRLSLCHANFADIKRELKVAGIESADAIIADLGVSSMQIDSETRGFSFRFDAPLDMRMDETADIETAADILETRSEKELADLIYQYGEERFSRRIARKIIDERNLGKGVKTTKQLADLVSRCIPRKKNDTIHPATKTFQALRIAVNNELGSLNRFVEDSIDILTTNGILAVITFHSLEDRIVKNAFQRFAGKCICPPKIPQCMCGARKRAEILTKKPIIPGRAELMLNPRSRSAKLRVINKVAVEGQK